MGRYTRIILIFVVVLIFTCSWTILYGNVNSEKDISYNYNLSTKSTQTTTQFLISESAGLERINEPVSVTIASIPSVACYHDSVRVHFGGIEIPSQVTDKETHTDPNFLKKFTVWFLANVSGNSYTTYSISYDSTSQGAAGYTDIQRNGAIITDENGCKWTFMTSSSGYSIGASIQDPSSNIICGNWGNGAGEGFNTPTCVENGPIFSKWTRTTSGFYIIHIIFKNGYSLIRMKDDNKGQTFAFEALDGTGTDEVHWKYGSSWAVQDPPDYLFLSTIALYVASSSTGKFLFQNDGQPWITAVVWDSSKTGATYFGIAGNSGWANCYIGISPGDIHNLEMGMEYISWSCAIKSTAGNDAKQRQDVEDLHNKLILNPLFISLYSPMHLPDIFNIILVLSFTGLAGLGVFILKKKEIF